MRLTWQLCMGIVGVAACGRCPAAETSEPPQTDYGAFAIIYERNIFNPNRTAPRQSAPAEASEPAAPEPAETFTLVGTMSYEKGAFAFFAGSSPGYQKVLRREDEIAGFMIADIAADAVTLSTSNSAVVVRVGSGMQRDHVAGWRPASGDSLAPRAEAQAATPPQAVDQEAPERPQPSRDSAESDGEVLKKLMQKREQELQ